MNSPSGRRFTIDSKSRAEETLQIFEKSLAVPMGLHFQHCCSDRGIQYIALYFKRYCRDPGIRQEFASINPPQHNRVSERDGWTLAERAPCLLADSGF